MDLQHGSAPQPGDRMSLTKPTVAVENVEYEKSGDYRLSPGSAVVGGREVHQSLTNSGPLRTSVWNEEGLMHGDPRQLQNEETGSGARLHYPADDVGDV